MRPGMAPGPGLEALRAAVAAAGAAGPRFARTSPFSDPHELLNCRMGAAGIGPGGLAPGGEGPVFGVQAPSPSGRTWNCQSPPPPPARCQTPGVSGVRRWEGRAGESTSSLLLATGFVPLARPGAHSVSKVGPHPPGPVVCAVVAVPLIRRKCPLPSRALVGLSAGGRETYYRSY